ncbi:hypothetical protein, partial [uncultured Dysosmobacter sp.]|uniref:hypothetical protein n=1 Tax=uncultured Dysosmobacter sp. TaxID=2591384 RepID=UPI002615F3C8
NNLDEDGNLINQFVRMLDKDEIITVALTPDQVFTKSVDGKDAYKTLGKSLCTTTGADGYDWTAYVNGKEVRAEVPEADDDDEWIYTGEGVQTEIYVDDADQTVRVVEINYYLGQVTRVRDTEDGEEVTIKSLSRGGELNVKTVLAEGYAEDDYVIFTVDYVEDDDDYIVGELFAPETVTDTVKRVEYDKEDGATYLKTEDGKYIYSEALTAEVASKAEPEQQQHMVYDLDDPYGDEHPSLSVEYVLYLDPLGYVVAFQEAGDSVADYLYVKDADEHLGTWEAVVILADGSSKTVTLNSSVGGTGVDTAENIKLGESQTDSGTIRWITTGGDEQHASGETANIVGHVYSYSVNSSDVYKLTDVPDIPFGALNAPKADDAQIRNGKAYIEEFKNKVEVGNGIIVDRKTAFVITKDKVAYIGYPEVPDIDKAQGRYVAKKGVAEAVFVVDGNIYSGSGRYFVLSDAHWESEKVGSTTYRVYDKGAYENGEKIGELWVADDANNGAELIAGVLYKITKTEKDTGYVTEVVRYVDVVSGVDPAIYTYTQTDPDVEIKAGEYVSSGDNAFRIVSNIDLKTYKFDTDEDTIFVTVEIDNNGDVTVGPGNIKDAMYRDKADENQFYKTVFVIKTSNDAQTADLVYIFVEDKNAPDANAPAGYKGTVPITNDATGAAVAYVDEVNLVNGYLSFTLEYDAPEWIATGTSADATITKVNVLVNGAVADDSITRKTIHLDEDGVGYLTAAVHMPQLTSTDKVSFEIDDVNFTAVKIRYWDVDNNVELDIEDDLAATPAPKTEVATGTLSSFGMPFKMGDEWNTLTGSLTLNVFQDTGAETSIDEDGALEAGTELLDSDAAVTNAASAQFSATLNTDTVNATGYVTAYVTGLSKLYETYDVATVTATTTLSAVKGTKYTGSATISKITPSQNTVKGGTDIYLTVDLGTPVGEDNLPLRVTLANGVSFILPNTAKTTGAQKVVYTVDGDVTAADLAVVSVVEDASLMPQVDRVEVTDLALNGSFDQNDVITIYFTKKVDKTTYDAKKIKNSGALTTTDNGEYTLATDGMSASYTLGSETLGAAATITITANSLKDATTGCSNNKQITISIPNGAKTTDEFTPVVTP